MKNYILFIFLFGFMTVSFGQITIPIDDCGSNPVYERYYRDSDRDFYGDPNIFMDRCGPAPGWAFNNTDCDDSDPNIKGPKRWYTDADGDGLGDPNGLSQLNCTKPSGNFVDNKNDCNDGDAAIMGKTAFYLDNDKDGQASTTSAAEYHCSNPSTSTTYYVTASNRNDCDDSDSSIQEITWYIDTDGDGFGETSSMIIRCTKPFGEYVRNNNDLCPGVGGDDNGCPPAGTNAIEFWNTVQVTNYDITETEVAKSKSYYDDLGKSVQTQTKDYKTNKIWASQTLYDSQGRPALQTLSAPTNQDIPSDFLYRENFILNDTNNIFSSTNFEGADVENPSEVGTQPNSLGWYYSENNNVEQYQDVTDRPYSRTIYSELNPGAALKTIGGNKMNGAWKNGYVFSMPAGQELTQPDAFNDQKYHPDNYKIIKTVARDVHGVESVIFTDTDGRTLAAARSGNEEGNTAHRPSTVTIKEQGFVDIHIPVGKQGLTITGNSGVALDIYNLITEGDPITTPIESLSPGFYRIAVQDMDSYVYNSTASITIEYYENYYDYSLNYYDKAGRLISSKQPLNKLESKFSYNALGQLEYTHSPDEGDAFFLYRRDGQIRFSINTKQWGKKQFSYTNYDKRGRPVESGVFSDASSGYLNVKPATITESSTPFKAALLALIDTQDGDGLVDTSCSEVHKTTYDALPVTDSNTLPTSYRNPSFLAGNVAKTQNTDKDRNVVSTTYYSYDIYGRVQWLLQDIAGLGLKTIHYEYDPVTSQINRVVYQKGEPDQFIHQYTYDPVDYSLVKVETATNPNGPFTEHAAYEYYETGGLKTVNLAKDIQGNYLQSIDYVYNLNGALKSINHPSLQGTNDPGGDNDDIFGMNIHYYKNDYKRSHTQAEIPSTQNGIDQYNGNIKAITWNTRKQDNTAGSPNTYYYDYNKNNWLKGASFNQNINDGDPNLPESIERAQYTQPNELARRSITLEDGFSFKAGTTGTLFTAKIDGGLQVQSDAAYNVSGITYDANGNIQSLKRNRDNYNGNTAMDQLQYTYDSEKPNQLKQVVDNARAATNADDIKTQDANNYTYNEIGQLIYNEEEKISYIYNASGLVTEVLQDNQPMVKFFYNDRGHRVRKESLVNNYTEHYVRDAAGSVMAIYRDTGIEEYPIYGASRLGVHKVGGATLYELTDHLGNVRAVVSNMQANKTPVGATDYYPFGMPMPNRNLKGDYRYAYQGQEVDSETGKEAFQLRLWDARIGRWLTTDPYGQYSSPYLGMGNNPISRIDPDGGEDWVFNKETERYEWQENVTSATDSDLNTDLFEYVGIGRDDIDRHFDNNNNAIASFFLSPKIDTRSYVDYLDKSLNTTLQTFIDTNEPQRFDNIRGLYENWNLQPGGTANGFYRFTPNLTINGETVTDGVVYVQFFKGTRKWNIISNVFNDHQMFNGKINTLLKTPYRYNIFSHHMKSEHRIPIFTINLPPSARNFANSFDALISKRSMN